MSKQSQLVKNTLIIAVGKLSTQFLSFLLLPLYTIFLSPKDFGQIDIIMVYLAVLAPTLTVQMEMAVFRHLIDARGNASNTRLAISSSSAIMLAGAILGALGILLVGLVLKSSFTLYLVGVFLTAVLASYLFQVARGIGRNDIFAIASIITGIVNIIVTCLMLIVFRSGIEGVLLASMLASVSGTIFLLVSTKYVNYLRLAAVDKTEIRSLFNYAWPLVPNHISLWGINGISRTVVVAVLGFTAMGIYAAAARFSLIYASLYSIFAMSWTEAVSVHIKDKSDDFISKTTDATVRLFGGLSIVIVAGVALIFPLLVHSEFADARYYVPPLILGAFLSSLVTHYGAIYLAMHKTKQIAIITVQAVVISTVITLLLMNPLSLYAPVVALILTYGYLVVRRHGDVQQYVEIRYKRTTYPLLAVLAVIVFSLYYMDSLYTNIAAACFAVIGFLFINYNSLSAVKTAVFGKLIKSKSED